MLIVSCFHKEIHSDFSQNHCYLLKKKPQQKQKNQNNQKTTHKTCIHAALFNSISRLLRAMFQYRNNTNIKKRVFINMKEVYLSKVSHYVCFEIGVCMLCEGPNPQKQECTEHLYSSKITTQHYQH